MRDGRFEGRPATIQLKVKPDTQTRVLAAVLVAAPTPRWLRFKK
jgi:hypothetical protein